MSARTSSGTATAATWRWSRCWNIPKCVQTCILQAANAAPNSTPEDLARVTCPVFVIQGANDVVNAPDRHAQFIAQHIPDAELWVPAQVAHNVHQEIPLEWLARVSGFSGAPWRRGQRRAVSSAPCAYADTRETIFDVRAAPSPARGWLG